MPENVQNIIIVLVLHVFLKLQHLRKNLAFNTTRHAELLPYEVLSTTTKSEYKKLPTSRQAVIGSNHATRKLEMMELGT